MKVELLPSQRRLVGLRLHMADAEIATKYVFPFVGREWTVPFYAVDAMGRGPQIFQGSLELRNGALSTKEPATALGRISSVPLETFEEVVHFDPWWVFRGASGVEREWIRAILATNLAGTFNHEGSTYKVHDLEFDASLRTLTGLVAKDPVFRAVTLRKGDVDLLLLRKPTRV